MKGTLPFAARILVPVDFSKLAESAVRYARGFAKQTKSELTLLHVVDTDVPPAVLSDRLEQAQEGFRKLSVRGRGRPCPKVKFDYGVAEGQPFERVVEQYIQQREADLIVMGTKGANALESPHIGHNAAAILSVCTVPVLLVPPGARYRTIERIAFCTHLNSKHVGLAMLARFAKVLHAATELLYLGTSSATMQPTTLQQQLTASLAFPKLEVAIRDGEAEGDVVDAFLDEVHPDLLAISRPVESMWDLFVGSNPSRAIPLHSDLPLLIIHGE